MVLVFEEPKPIPMIIILHAIKSKSIAKKAYKYFLNNIFNKIDKKTLYTFLFVKLQTIDIKIKYF